MGIKITSWKKLGIGLLIFWALFDFSASFVKAADQSDAIGVRIMPNPNHISISDWYKQQGFKGAPQSLTVDGYEAIRDGRTVFVNAANLDSNSNKLYTNIYLISYNQESEVKTVDILGQLVSHWKFNSNLSSLGKCSISNRNCQADTDCLANYICSNLPGSADQGKCVLKEAKQCLIDSDCPLNLFCDSLKAKLTRDVKRLGSLGQIRESLDSFKAVSGNYPNLQTGTYVSGSSLSLWPSWQGAFWSQLKLNQVLIDPINSLGYCPGHNSLTCWNEESKSFINDKLVLPYGSYAFLYQAASNGVNYDLCAVFESKIERIDTAEGQFTSNSCAVGAGYGGVNSNKAPTLVGSYTDGEAGKEFNGFLKAKDADGDLIFWNLSPITQNWSSWSEIPSLKDSGDLNQKKMSALKAGNPGLYKMLLKLSDSRGATSSSEIIFNISTTSKPIIEAENVDYFVDPINPLKYTFYIQGSNSKPSYTFLPLDSQKNTALNNAIKDAVVTETKLGTNRIKVDLSILFPFSIPIVKDISIPYQITATAGGASLTHDININLKMEQPILDFQCENMARKGQAYQISGSNQRPCLLGPIKSGNHRLTYSVSGPLGLAVSSDNLNAYLGASNITSSVVDNEVKINVTNEYSAKAEKIFILKVNTFCGDGIKQNQNSEERGGYNNDGVESCDGSQGVITNTISTSSSIQYGCTTEFNVPATYPILDGQKCIFKPSDNGGGYCGDGLCQFQILVNGQPKMIENCWNCRQDCGSCVATVVSSADQEHISFVNGKQLYKELVANTSTSATTTLVSGKNVFSFWTHNLNDADYGLAFKITTGPKKDSTTSTPISFVEFNSSNSELKCTKDLNSPGSALSNDSYVPMGNDKDNEFNWTEADYTKDKDWFAPVINKNKALFNGGPYVWSEHTEAANEATYCRLNLFYKPFDMATCKRECNNKNCGPDGCGNDCGFCRGAQYCNSSQNCACLPGTCGDLCVTCKSYEHCSAGSCVCTPKCDGKVCGPDGCGGDCGRCASGKICTLGACCPDEADIQVCADNSHLTYFNGALVGQGNDWQNVEKFPVRIGSGKNVIAIRAVNAGDIHGLAVTLNQGVCKSMTTNDVSGWKCTGTEYAGWRNIDFNDSNWPQAAIAGAAGVRPGNYLTYKQIWTDIPNVDGSSGSTIYCRYSFGSD